MNLATGPGAAAEESPAVLSVNGALNGVAISKFVSFPMCVTHADSLALIFS